jgi:Tol biopolymer transport system component
LLQSTLDGNFRIYKQDLDKDTPELITSGPGSQRVPRISPDGRWVLYLSFDDVPGGPKTRLMRIPIAGGTAQEVFPAEGVSGFHCSNTAGRACVLAETRGKASIFSLLDPMKGRGPKVLETTVNAGGPDISPNGQHIAFVLPGPPHNRIRIVDLHGATEGEITVLGAQDLQSLDWSADGTGFFCADVQPETTRLLHVQRNGTSHVLLTHAPGWAIWGVPSPDGRYLATFKGSCSSNVWMVENP